MKRFIKLMKNDSYILLAGPYNEHLVTQLTRLNGNWNGSNWLLKIEFEKNLLELLKETWNWTPACNLGMLTVTISSESKAERIFTTGSGDLYLFNLPVVHTSQSEDKKVSTSENVRILSGNIDAEGSDDELITVLSFKDTAKIELNNVPCPKVLNYNENGYSITAEFTPSPARSFQSLIDERNSLYRRIKDIDSALSEHDFL